MRICFMETDSSTGHYLVWWSWHSIVLHFPTPLQNILPNPVFYCSFGVVSKFTQLLLAQWTQSPPISTFVHILLSLLGYGVLMHAIYILWHHFSSFSIIFVFPQNCYILVDKLLHKNDQVRTIIYPVYLICLLHLSLFVSSVLVINSLFFIPLLSIILPSLLNHPPLLTFLDSHYNYFVLLTDTSLWLHRSSVYIHI